MRYVTYTAVFEKSDVSHCGRCSHPDEVLAQRPGLAQTPDKGQLDTSGLLFGASESRPC